MVCAVKSEGHKKQAFLRVLKYSSGGVIEVILLLQSFRQCVLGQTRTKAERLSSGFMVHY